MLSVRFLFIAEGTSDNELVNHLERCCILAGADEASGVAPDFSRLPERTGHTVAAKLRVALDLESNVDIAFLHRDADSRDSGPRYNEIREAVQGVRTDLKYVAVVPVQETEAWLLLNETEIRSVAENPSGGIFLDLPSSSIVENIADPKARLEQIILEASEQSGRRRDKISRKFPQKRGLLLRRLDPEGSVRGVPSWTRMFSELTALMDILK